MDDIYLIRLRNFSWLLKTHSTAENQSEFGRLIDKVPASINRILHGKKIGDDLAREIEAKLQLEAGWMDNVHPTSLEESILEAFRKASRERQETVADVLKVTFERESDQQQGDQDSSPMQAS